MITIIAMITGIVIGYVIAVFIRILDNLAVFAKKYPMEEAVRRYNYFASIEAGKAAAAWKKIIIERLLQGYRYNIDEFIKEIDPREISSFNFHEIFKGNHRITFFGDLYDCAVSYKKDELAEIFGILARKMITTEKLAFSLNFPDYENFFTNALVPAVKENLSKISSLQVLKEWRANCTERIRLLIEEREIEIINDKPPETFSEFFDIFQIIGCESSSGKYLIQKFTEFLTNKECRLLNDDDDGKPWWYSHLLWRKNRDCRIEGLFIDLIKEYSYNPSLIIPIKMCLEVALPNLDGWAIDKWLEHFSHNPEYVTIFIEKLKFFCARATVEELVKKWRQYSAISQIKTFFDFMMIALVTKANVSEIKNLWLKLPSESEAWRLAAHRFWMNESGGGQADL